MIHIFCEQRSDEWFRLRRGIPTASSFSKIMTSKLDYSKSAEKYAWDLVGESFGIERDKVFVSHAMQHGIDFEDEASFSYSLTAEAEVEECGFIFQDDRKFWGASPDRLIGDDGLLEIKCPQPARMVEYHEQQKLPTQYIQQVYGQLLVTGRKWLDFYAYHPEMKPFLIRVNADSQKQNKVQDCLERFTKYRLDLIERYSNVIDHGS
jgi:putative phage-type endonuclease